MDTVVANDDNSPRSQPPSQSPNNPYAASMLGPLAMGAMHAPNTAVGFATAIKYIDNFFEARGVGERFYTLEEEHVEGDHLRHIFDNLFHWLATTSFAVNTASGFMVTSGKDTKFKQMKSAFRNKFPNHPLFKTEEYWSTMKTQFNKKCINTRITDTDIFEERVSVPLYRTIDDTLIRQKYRGDPTSMVDAVAVSISFIVNGSANSCHKLAEQNLS